jgi:ATP-dependent protease ClpP protease subunit
VADIKDWYSIEAKAGGIGVISIFDDIGGGWFSEGVTAVGFKANLDALGDVDDIEVQIASRGGSVLVGQAIYNMLKNHKAKVTVKVMGIAASIASVITMAGDTVEMPEDGLLMIHNPRGGASGESGDLRKAANAMDSMRTSMIGIYESRTALTSDEIGEMMDAETWIDATMAEEMGFADKITQPTKAVANFDLSIFDSPPEVVAIDQAGNGLTQKEPKMADPKEPVDKPVITREYLAQRHPEIVTAIQKEGATAEGERIQSIMNTPLASSNQELIKPMLFDGSSTGATAALAILAAQEVATKAKADAIAADAKALDDVTASLDVTGKTLEEQIAAEWNASDEIKAEFGELSIYKAYRENGGAK